MVVRRAGLISSLPLFIDAEDGDLSTSERIDILEAASTSEQSAIGAKGGQVSLPEGGTFYVLTRRPLAKCLEVLTRKTQAYRRKGGIGYQTWGLETTVKPRSTA